MANWAEQTKHRGGAAVDTISELTAASGVTADGVLLKDSAVTAASGVSTNTITEHTSGSGVTIDGVLLKDGGITATGTNSINLTTISADTINETTLNAGVTIDGVLLKDATVTASGTNGIITDTITERTSASGVTVDGLLIKDGEARWIMPSGVIVPYGGAVAPSGWLLCDGTAVSRTTYAALFAVLSTTFGSGDGSTTFNLPDMRETIPVGVGTRGAGVTEHDAYTLGQFKDDQMQGHYHEINTNGTDKNVLNGKAVAGNQASTYAAGDTSGIIFSLEIQSPRSDGTNGTPRTGTTTHGKQMGLNYIIKY